MKIIHITIFIALFSCIINCKTTQRNTSNRDLTQVISYEVETKRKFVDSIRVKFQNDKSLNAQENLNLIENPKLSLYHVRIGTNISETSYQEKLSNDQEKSNLKRNAAPFGFVNTYRFEHDNKAYMLFDQLEEGLAAGIEFTSYKWTNINKDSIINNFKVEKYHGFNNDSEIFAWVTKELKSKFGLYNLYCPYGYILSFELRNKKNPAFEYEIIQAKPYDFNVKNINIDIPNIKKVESINDIQMRLHKINNHSN